MPASAGKILFEGVEVAPLTRRARPRDLVRLQMVFQNPFSSLNPRRTIGAQLAEAMLAAGFTRRAGRGRVAELLELVGLSPGAAERYPHQFSGGQRQRIAVARALAAEPSVIVLDEPLSSLDASAQAQLANVLVDLARKLEIGLLLISHDLAIVRYAADAISVMYLGRIVEDGPPAPPVETPLHPYTEALIGAVPHADGAGTLPEALPGEVPDPARPPSRLPLPSALPLPVRPLHGRRAAAASARRRANGRLLAPRRRPHATPAAREGCGPDQPMEVTDERLDVRRHRSLAGAPARDPAHGCRPVSLRRGRRLALHRHSLAGDAADAGDPEPRGRAGGGARLRRAARRGALVGRGRARDRGARLPAVRCRLRRASRRDSRSSSPTSCARRGRTHRRPRALRAAPALEDRGRDRRHPPGTACGRGCDGGGRGDPARARRSTASGCSTKDSR